MKTNNERPRFAENAMPIHRAASRLDVYARFLVAASILGYVASVPVMIWEPSFGAVVFVLSLYTITSSFALFRSRSRLRAGAHDATIMARVALLAALPCTFVGGIGAGLLTVIAIDLFQFDVFTPEAAVIVGSAAPAVFSLMLFARLHVFDDLDRLLWEGIEAGIRVEPHQGSIPIVGATTVDVEQASDRLPVREEPHSRVIVASGYLPRSETTTGTQELPG